MLHVFLHRSRRHLVVALIAAIVALGVGFLLSAFAPTARAQGAAGKSPSSAITYVYLRDAGDTLGLEVLSQDSLNVTGVLSIKGQPRIQWSQRKSTTGPGMLSMDIFAPGAADNAKALQSGTIVMTGDSAFVDFTSATQRTKQALPSKSGAFPLVNASVLHAALIAAHARTSKIGTINIFLTSGAQTMAATVSQSGDTTIFKLASSDMRIVSGPDGMPLSIQLPGQGAHVIRATGAVNAGVGRINYNAPADAPYVAEHVKIPSGRGYDLAATLTKPKGVSKMPVVVTISGSGPQERDSRISIVPGYEIFRQIADTLGRRGIAVLRFDDRGVGESGGRESAAKGTSADFADDVRSIVTWLRARSDIDPARIALAGHSEGGIIAPMVAAGNAQIKAIALLAGPAYDGRKVLMFQNRQGIDNAPGLSTTQRDSIWKTVPAALDSISKANPWMGFFMTHNPLATARRVTQPVLLLQGETDRQVTAEQVDSLNTVLRANGNRDVTLRKFPATNHLFLNDASGLPGGYAQLKDPKVRKDVLGALADWAARVLR
ncbi:MAG: alpha/beta fold hydrolase [Gemmatimonadaceae bacterium]|nr:alpha/beta fold hydrolase [Gemmatimonadaceae bacterium]